MGNVVLTEEGMMGKMFLKLLAGGVCLFVFTTVCFAKDYPLSKTTRDELLGINRIGIELSGTISNFVQKHEKEMLYETKLNLSIITDKLLLVNAYMLGLNLMFKIEDLHHSAGQPNVEALKVIKDYAEAALREVKDEKNFVVSLAKERKDLTDEQKTSIVSFYNNAEIVLGRVIEEL